MKRIVLAITLLTAPLWADGPTFELLATRGASLRSDHGQVDIAVDSRVLKIHAPQTGATAYQIHIITAGANGERRTWSYVIARHEQRYGDFQAKTSATFFTLPIDADIPILDIWVSGLSVSGDPAHVTPTR